MPIGNGPDLPEYDKEREMKQREMDTMYKWWDSLNDEEQYNLILDWYPMEITKDTDIDKFFGDMDSKRQLYIYKEENSYRERRK